MKKLSKFDFTDFYYCAEQKLVSLVTSLFKNPVRSVQVETKKCDPLGPGDNLHHFISITLRAELTKREVTRETIYCSAQ